MKGTLKVLNSQGHSAVEYDTEAGIVDEAERILAEARMQNAALFDGGTKERVPNQPGRTLEEHDELIVVPPMAGGR